MNPSFGMFGTAVFGSLTAGGTWKGLAEQMRLAGPMKFDDWALVVGLPGLFCSGNCYLV